MSLDGGNQLTTKSNVGRNNPIIASHTRNGRLVTTSHIGDRKPTTTIHARERHQPIQVILGALMFQINIYV
jgi:hypothetical protein